MDHATSNLSIVFILTIGFAFASILGYLTQRLKISPLLGYLMAGFLIGPYSPGFVADTAVAEQLAEIGVILMMFGVGLHLKWENMVSVKNIAIPGAIAQTLLSALLGTLLAHFLGWTWSSGAVIGLSIGVASTVVLLRVLVDNKLVHTTRGSIAVGWLIVEDILTVIVLVLLPILASNEQAKSLSMTEIASSIVFICLKFTMLAAFMFTIGQKIVKFILIKIARTRSHELFTLTILTLIFVIATGSSILFGASIALGAFIAGMVVGQTHVSHQASANALPMQDTFVVIFFLSAGMLFNPLAILDQPGLFFGILSIVLLAKPLIAFVIVWLYKYPLKTALTVAFALSQIGEFSFILSEGAMKLHILPESGFDVIVACALISISINPLLFISLEPLMAFLIKNRYIHDDYKDQKVAVAQLPEAIIVGYGPVGRGIADTLSSLGYTPIIIDNNVDTIGDLLKEDRQAIYGDAITSEILEAAHVKNAKLLVITIPDIIPAVSMISTAEQLNPNLKTFIRVRFTKEKLMLKHSRASIICCEDESFKVLNSEITEWIQTQPS
jgi:CPA2 family monovalent cation:H+ antiporter-2